jgi:hypothetical protein
MSTIQTESIPLPLRWLRAIVGSTLPRSLREEYLVSFDQYRERSMLYQIKHAAMLVFGAYLVLVVPALRACGPYAPLAEVVLIVYCFQTAAATRVLSPWILLPLASMLCALSLRDIWWHPGKRRARAQLPPLQEYYLQSSMDALCACLFLFLGQGLAWHFARAVAVPDPFLFRGAALCMPVLPTLRLTLRPMPDPKSPFEGQGMSAIEMFRATCRLNILWAVLYCGTIGLGFSDIDYYVPDFLRGAIPIMLIVIFFAVRRDGLERMNRLQRLFVSLEEQALAACGRFLPRQLRPGDPFYRAAFCLKWFIFAGLALVVEATIRPWLTGSVEADLFVVVGNIIGLTVCVLTWRYVDKANHITAGAVHEELQRLRAVRRAS